jgi:hypothetical protein
MCFPARFLPFKAVNDEVEVALPGGDKLVAVVIPACNRWASLLARMCWRWSKLRPYGYTDAAGIRLSARQLGRHGIGCDQGRGEYRGSIKLTGGSEVKAIITHGSETAWDSAGCETAIISWACPNTIYRHQPAQALAYSGCKRDVGLQFSVAANARHPRQAMARSK